MGKGIHKFAIKENSGTIRHNWKYSLAQSYCPQYLGLVMLLIPAYGALHNLLYGYYPYTYSYMPLNLWFILTGLIYGLQADSSLQTIWPKGIKTSNLSSAIQRFFPLLVRIIHQGIFRQVMGKHKNHAWFRDWQTSNQKINRTRANTKDIACLIYYLHSKIRALAANSRWICRIVTIGNQNRGDMD